MITVSKLVPIICIVASVLALVGLAIMIYCVIKSESFNMRIRSYYRTGNRVHRATAHTTAHSGPSPFEKLEDKEPLAPWLEERLFAAGVDIDSNQFLLLWLVLGAMVVLLAAFAGGLVIGAIALVVVGAGPMLLLLFLKGKQGKKFDQQLADSLPRIVSSLRAGSSFPLAVASIAESSSEPIASEFGRVKSASDVGIPIEDAIYEMADRMNSKDLILLGQAIEIQRETGGSLADIIETTADKIRYRLKLKQMISSITAESRLSMVIAVAAPTFMYFFMTSQNEMWSDFFMNTTIGHVCIFIIICLMALGVFLSVKMVNLKIE